MSLWHCEEHGLTGPMACCAKACRIASAQQDATGVLTTTPMTAEQEFRDDLYASVNATKPGAVLRHGKGFCIPIVETPAIRCAEGHDLTKHGKLWCAECGTHVFPAGACGAGAEPPPDWRAFVGYANALRLHAEAVSNCLKGRTGQSSEMLDLHRFLAERPHPGASR